MYDTDNTTAKSDNTTAKSDNNSQPLPCASVYYNCCANNVHDAEPVQPGCEVAMEQRK